MNDIFSKGVKNILAFFASDDGLVGLNILENFTKDVKCLEGQYAYNFQCTMEAIHSEMYSLLIDSYIDDLKEKNKLFNAIHSMQCIKDKANWALKWFDTNSPFKKRLLGFIIIEGLFFSGAFCSIYWIKEKGLLQGLTKSNEFIARDERLHTEFGFLLYNMIKSNIDEFEIYEMINEAVKLEINFINEAIPIKLIGMNSDLMSQYIKYIADWILININCNKKYNVDNPFNFMNNIGIESKSNFFDERTSNYQNAYIFNNSKDLSFSDNF